MGAVLQTQTTSRWAQTVRFTSTDLQYHFVNPTPTGEPFDPFGYGPNYLGQTVTISRRERHERHRAGDSRFRGHLPADLRLDARHGGWSRRKPTTASPRSLSLSAGVRFDDENGFDRLRAPRSRPRGTTAARSSRRATAWASGVYLAGGVGFDHNAVFGFAATPRLSGRLPTSDARQTARSSETRSCTFNAGTGIKAPSILKRQSSLFSLLNACAAGRRVDLRVGVSPIGPERSRSVDVGRRAGRVA